MDRNSINWRGYIPAITTPFNDKDELDTGMLKSLLEWLLEEGMHGIVLAGTTGEWFSMSLEEKTLLFKTAADTVSGKMTLVAGCNAFTAKEVIASANIASKYGFDGILVTPPPYIKPSDRGIYNFYKDINDAIDLPICIYNWPPGTGIDMNLPLLEKICKLDNVVALKNSTGNSKKFHADAEALYKKVRIFGVPLNESGIKLLQEEKSFGLMGSGAVLGHFQSGFFEELWKGNIEKALEYGNMDRQVMNDWFDVHYMAKFGTAQAIMKTALNLRGLPGGQPRRPIMPLNEEETDIIRKTLQKLDIL